MTREEVISGLQMTMDLIQFDPFTGDVRPIYALNDLDKTTYVACKEAIEALKAQPEIIRCKDCKYSHDEYGDGDCYCKRPGRTMDWFGQRWDYYCGDAKRRTDEAD